MVAVGAVTLLAAACGSSNKSSTSTSSGSSGSSGSNALTLTNGSTGKGVAGEGPYPWKYPASGSVTLGSGTTIGGTACTPSTPQFDSPYADPCVAKFTGSNGGATYNGVTANTITISRREFPETANGQEIAAQAKNEGYALPQVTDQVMQTFVNYFNSAYDLYGRKVVIQPVASTSNYTAELLNTNQAQACADADKIANQVHAFGDIGIGEDFQGGGTSVFAQCAAQQKMMVFDAAAYFNEGFYQQNNPYIWGIAQDCTRIANNSAEAYSKLLAGKPANYAGDASLRTQTRKFGIYVPNLPAYTSCTTQSQQEMEQLYHIPASAVSTEFTYGLDISTFQQSAQQAIVQFKAAGVTTIITACDSFSLALLTKAAAAQNYHPEWLLNGVAGDDTDSVAQTYDPSEVTGHLFGLSEASPQTQIFGPSSLAGQLYQKLTGHQIPAGTDGYYSDLVWMFDALQAAGPDLTPQNVARGVHALPALGAPNYTFGKWDLSTNPEGKVGYGDHTLISDARFIYWNGNGTSQDNGQKGTYVPVFSGQRFGIGQWPTKLPPLFTVSGSQDASCSC
ncbi:MAG: hypothetical protein ACYCSJ_06235 [Acidimicrobiales bacterium]